MTRLRSREVVPKINPKGAANTKNQSQSSTTESGVSEPSTPAKNVEFLNQQSSSSTPSMSTLGGSLDPKELESRSGSKSVSVTRPVRRRSLRLAEKSGLGLTGNMEHVGISREKGKNVENVEISSEKGKNADSEEEEDCNNGCDSGNLKSEGGGDGENTLLHMEMKKVKVSEQVAAEISSVGNTAGKVKIGSEEVGLYDAMISTSGESGKRVEGERRGKGKRKLGIEVGLLGSQTNENEKKCLSLRSGKRVSRIGVEGKSGSCGGEEEVQGAESKTMLNVGNLKGVEVDESMTNVNGSGNLKGRSKFTREEKAKGKLVENASSIMRETVEMEVNVSIADKVLETPHLAESVHAKAVDKDLGTAGYETGVMTRGRLSRADKGKEKLNDDLSELELICEKVLEEMTESNVSGTAHSAETVALQEREQIGETNVTVNSERRGQMGPRERFRDLARRNASRFAHFSSQEEENHVNNDVEVQTPPPETDGVKEDWPGPFSTAMKIIKDREMNSKVQQQIAFSGKSKDPPIIWVPKKDQQLNRQKQFAPTLQELCWPVLVKNADAITSLDCIPDVLKHKLSQMLCDSRMMNSHFLELLVSGSPTEIRVYECSWLTEEIFTKIFEGCDTKNLMVLQLDQCGRCLPDHILSSTLARSPNSMPALTTISVKGAYSLSDVGLRTLVSSAPSLRSINLSQCSLLTSDGISYLADSLGSVLRELYLDDCQGVNAMLILPALLKLQNLEVLSLAGVAAVSDKFINKFVTACGQSLKELILKDCLALTDSSLKVIAEKSPGLCAIDISNVSKLTDAAIGYLANGCRTIQKLKLCRNMFSDEAIAAYLETCGDSLDELSLNHVSKVSYNTAVSLAKCSKNLQTLDLSWCRRLSNEALGLIVDSCSSLKVLKLFGCTQVNDVFLNGHSNPQVRIIGVKMTPLLQHTKQPDFMHGPLRYSSAF